MTPGLFDALRDGGYERAAFLNDARGARAVFARPDEDEVPLGDDAPPALVAAAAEAAAAVAAAMDVRRLECVYRKDVGLRIASVRRSSTEGRTIGPVRRVDLAQSEPRVFRDVCVAARHAALSAKAAGISRGGAAVFLHATPAPEHDRARFAQALADELQLFGGDFWVDAGLGDEWAKDAAKRGASLAGARTTSSAETTALGVVAAVRVALGAIGPRADDLSPVVVLQGLGRVGAAVGRRLAVDGFRLVVSDRDYPKIDAFLGRLGPTERKNVSVVAPYQVAEVVAKAGSSDVFCPAAEGGVITADLVGRLKCRAVVGAATGIFDAASAEDERSAALRLHAAGILYVPEWLAGAGGLIHAAFECADRGAKFESAAAEARTERVAGWYADDVVGDSKHQGHAPIEILAKRGSAPV